MAPSKSLRFLRAVALLSSSTAAAACSSTGSVETSNADTGVTAGDTSTSLDTSGSDDTAIAADTALNPDVPAGDGDCHQNFGTPVDLACAPGNACSFAPGVTNPSCVSAADDAGGTLVACGVISCGIDCYCTDATKSICECDRPVLGPLPPPDLPIA